LDFDIRDGWEPLCNFLGKPVPDVEFPKVNDSEAFKELVSVAYEESMERIAKLDEM
jgi:hypothetical protein